MLTHLSWTRYLETLTLLLAICYLFIGIRYYGKWVAGLTGRITGLIKGAPLAGQAAGPQHPASPAARRAQKYDPADEARKADALATALKKSIAAASRGAGDAQQQVRKLFAAHASLACSPHRPAINELVVSECARMGVAGLTEDEVDQWWSG